MSRLISGLLILLYQFIVLSWGQYSHTDDYSFVVTFEIENCEFSNFVLHWQEFLHCSSVFSWVWGLDYQVSEKKKAAEILIGI